MPVNGSEHIGDWPTYELVSLHSEAGVPPFLAARLEDAGVPRGCIGQEYRALPYATLVDNIAGLDLVAFGASGSVGRICIDIKTGAVVHVPAIEGPMVNPVNDGLDSFSECVSTVIARFPFYEENDAPEKFEEIAAEIRRAVFLIDNTTLNQNGFWANFADDVAIGDYATNLTV